MCFLRSGCRQTCGSAMRLIKGIRRTVRTGRKQLTNECQDQQDGLDGKIMQPQQQSHDAM